MAITIKSNLTLADFGKLMRVKPNGEFKTSEAKTTGCLYVNDKGKIVNVRRNVNVNKHASADNACLRQQLLAAFKGLNNGRLSSVAERLGLNLTGKVVDMSIASKPLDRRTVKSLLSMYNAETGAAGNDAGEKASSPVVELSRLCNMETHEFYAFVPFARKKLAEVNEVTTRFVVPSGKNRAVMTLEVPLRGAELAEAKRQALSDALRMALGEAHVSSPWLNDAKLVDRVLAHLENPEPEPMREARKLVDVWRQPAEKILGKADKGLGFVPQTIVSIRQLVTDDELGNAAKVVENMAGAETILANLVLKTGAKTEDELKEAVRGSYGQAACDGFGCAIVRCVNDRLFKPLDVQLRKSKSFGGVPTILKDRVRSGLQDLLVRTEIANAMSDVGDKAIGARIAQLIEENVARIVREIRLDDAARVKKAFVKCEDGMRELNGYLRRDDLEPEIRNLLEKKLETLRRMVDDEQPPKGANDEIDLLRFSTNLAGLLAKEPVSIPLFGRMNVFVREMKNSEPPFARLLADLVKKSSQMPNADSVEAAQNLKEEALRCLKPFLSVARTAISKDVRGKDEWISVVGGGLRCYLDEILNDGTYGLTREGLSRTVERMQEMVAKLNLYQEWLLKDSPVPSGDKVDITQENLMLDFFSFCNSLSAAAVQKTE